MNSRTLVAVSLAALLGAIAACHGSDALTPPAIAQVPGSVAETLAALGVDTARTDRVDFQGHALPADNSPLGRWHVVDPMQELYIGGVQLRNRTAYGSLIEDLSGTTGGGIVTPNVLFEVTEEQSPWLHEDRPYSSLSENTLRAATAADLFGDRSQQVVTVFYMEPELRVQVLRRVNGELVTTESTLLFHTTGIVDVAVAAGDFDGDGDDDLAVGYSLAGSATLFRASIEEDGQLRVQRNSSRNFGPLLSTTSAPSLVLAAGNLDHDAPSELVAVVNERFGPTIAATQLASRYHVFDDAVTGYAQLRSSFVEGFEANVGLQFAAFADVALGDIDGDGLDEIVFGGIRYLELDLPGCQRGTSPYVFVAVDDAAAGFADLGARQVDAHLCAGVNFDPRMFYVHINTLDLDGDGRAEVQGNEFVFDDWVAAAPWTQRYSLGAQEIIDEDGKERFGRTNSAIATGDVDGDGRDDIILYRDDRDQRGEVRVFSLPAGTTNTVRLARIEVNLASTDPNAPLGQSPILVPVDIDDDRPLLGYAGPSAFAFTEPVPLAAVAAPPCSTRSGQGVEPCRTTFGNAAAANATGAVLVATDRFAGARLVGDPDPAGMAIAAQVAQRIAGRRSPYPTSVAATFATPPGEDSVAFVTVPLDVYRYTVLRDADPALVGREVLVHLPRAAFVGVAERARYDRSLMVGMARIGDRVPAHTIGDPDSYANVGDRDAALAASGGLTAGPVAVGEGTGTIALQLDVGTAYAVGAPLAMDHGRTIATTLPQLALAGDVGASAAALLQVTSGTACAYTGVVAERPAGDPAALPYSFGMFAYAAQLLDGSRVQVVDYWVER